MKDLTRLTSILAVLLVPLAACDGAGGEASGRIRLVDPADGEPGAVFAMDRVSRLEPVDDGVAEISRWAVEAPASGRLGSGPDPAVLLLTVPRPPAVLRRQGGVPPDADLLEVALHGAPLPLFADLEWTVAGEDGAAATSSLRSLLPRRPTSRDFVVTFDLSGDPAWTGHADGVALRLGGLVGSLEVRSIQWWRRASDAEALREAATSLLALDAGNEVRPGFLLLPHVGWQRSVDLPGDARLELGFATSPGTMHPIEVVVEVASARGSRSARRRLVPSGDGRGWSDLALDLRALGSGQVQVRLAADVPPSWDPSREAVFVSQPQVVPQPSSERARPNVVIVSIDTLRADRMSLYGYPRPTTPGIEAWAARHAAVFEAAFSHASSTLPAHTSLFTGLEPLRHGAVNSIPAAAGLRTLAERLRDAGYATLGVTGGGYLHPAYGLAQGFDRFMYWPRGETDAHEEIEHGVALAEGLLEEYAREPFFLFFHTYEVHGPYRVRQPWAGAWGVEEDPETKIWPKAPQAAMAAPGQDGVRTADESPDLFLAAPHPSAQLGQRHRLLEPEEYPLIGDLYDTGVARADLFVTRLLDRLADLGLMDDTIVVLTSDHGEALGEHQLWSHGYLYDHNLHVPLVVAIPGVTSPGRRLPDLVRLVDVAPTILEAVGAAAAAEADGRTLLPLLRGDQEAEAPRILWSYAPETNHGLALRTARVKYVYPDTALGAGEPREELYELDRDPAEAHNLATRPEVTADLRREVLAALRRTETGLQLELRNRGGSSRQGWIESPSLLANTVKSSGSTGAARLELEEGGRLRFTLDGGARLRLRITAPATELVYAFGLDDTIVERGRAGLAGLCAGDVLGRSEDGAVDLRARLGGPFCGSGSGMAAAEDGELTDRLRALGYVE